MYVHTDVQHDYYTYTFVRTNNERSAGWLVDPVSQYLVVVVPSLHDALALHAASRQFHSTLALCAKRASRTLSSVMLPDTFRLGTSLVYKMASQEKREFDKYLKFLTFKVCEKERVQALCV